MNKSIENLSENNKTIFDSKSESRPDITSDPSLHTSGHTVMMGEGSVAVKPSFESAPWDSGVSSNDIISYMSRPTLVISGAFSDTVRSNVTGLAVDRSLFLALTNGNATGSLGIRATTCFRVDVSAAPQVSGIIKLAYIPFTPNTFGHDRGTMVPLYCQFPNSEINLAETTSAEIKIPFVFDRDFFRFVDTDRVAYFYLATYAGVNWDETTTSTPTYAVYAWLEDVELVDVASDNVSLVVPQSLGASSEKVGPLSGFFNSASRLLTWAGNGVPTLSSYFKPVAWALGGFGAMAAHFGYSKPNDGTWITMGSSRLRTYNTCLDVGQATELGYFANNTLSSLPGFAGTDIDEMAICHLTCKPGCISYFHLTPSDTRNTYKWACPVTPNRFYFWKKSDNTGFYQPERPSATDNTAFLPSPIMAVSQQFGAWRGDLVFRFKFSRTKFHGGKVLIGYNPLSTGADPTCVLPSDPRYNFRTLLVDLRTTSEVEFEVPFVYNRAYCVCDEQSRNLDTTGNIFLKVVDSLYCPSGVPTNVPVVVEVFAKCGLEFVMPKTAYITASPSGVAIVAQSLPTKAQYVVGEELKSIKQLMMRPSVIRYVESTPPVPYYIGDDIFLQWSLPVYSSYWRTGPSTVFGNRIVSNCISEFMTWFALWRGSVVYWLEDQADITELTWGQGNFYRDSRASERNIVASAKKPFYASSNRLRTPAIIEAGADGLEISVLGIGDTLRTAPATVARLGVAVADDFQLGHFISIPPCVSIRPQIDTGYGTTPQFTLTIPQGHGIPNHLLGVGNKPNVVEPTIKLDEQGGFIANVVSTGISQFQAPPPSPRSSRRPKVNLEKLENALSTILDNVT